ncbi:SNU114 (YKL173W) [Zygosaccharomyces parabailii]|nr:SNU114 (YKL173W) [Zygosaccharomyces parabailii]CDH11459.1 related to Pre-mRNA-splicing factor SNU114 [Zygosaccharomyces bailii ISA1307]
MDEYDEFGNLLKNGEDSLEVVDDGSLPNRGSYSPGDIVEEDGQNLGGSRALIPLQQAYGDDVEILIETEDNHDSKIPLVEAYSGHAKGPDYTVFTHLKKNVPQTTYDREYMLNMLAIPERIRNIAVIGPLHSGKTSLVDLLVIEAHQRLPHLTRSVKLGWSQMRYMDNTKQEIERGLTLKTNGMTFLGFDLDLKSVPVNLLDTPGHVNFMDETAVSLHATDCALLCIDVVEGITSVVENLIQYCQRSGLAMVFVLNKIDRLILELKLPPVDSYLKMAHIIDQINLFTNRRISPELGNVIFASSKLGFSFTIQEFVSYYYSTKLPDEKKGGFIDRLWGDVYFESGKFCSVPRTVKTPTFVEFILQPIYKIFTHTLSNDRFELQKLLRSNFAVRLDPVYLKYDPLPLLKHVLELVFKNQTGLVHALAHSYDPISSKHAKLFHSLRNPLKEEHECVAHALKTLDYGGSEWTLVRIYRGQIISGMQINVITPDSATSGEAVNIEEYEKPIIKEIALLGGRYLYPISHATEGQIVLVKGISESFVKSSTLYLGPKSLLPLFKPLDYINEPVSRVVLQPLIPKELPKLLNGLNKVSKFYPGVVVKVEESGEHVVLGCGELYLDCLLYDLRRNYANMEIKISTPLTVFAESCQAESFAAIPVTSINGEISISVGAEPLTPKLLRDLSHNKISENTLNSSRHLSKMLRTEYGWDSLAARNIWSFENGNVLVDDTLPDETDKTLLSQYKHQIKQGFKWATREGPLADEPIYGVHFKILAADNLEKVSGGGQLIPLVRKACNVAMLAARPVLLEPIYDVDVVVQGPLLPIVEELFGKRRGGRVYKTTKIVGTPLVEVRGQLPVIESTGFETDLRLSTTGAGMCQMHFWKKMWRKVPGDVMDDQAYIPKLKPAPIASLSRDFVMKTRRRKGISKEGFMSNDGPSLKKYIDVELYARLKENGLV